MVNVPKNLRNSSYQQKRRDKSIQVKHDEGGVVTSVMLAKKPSAHIAKVKLLHPPSRLRGQILH